MRRNDFLGVVLLITSLFISEQVRAQHNFCSNEIQLITPGIDVPVLDLDFKSHPDSIRFLVAKAYNLISLSETDTCPLALNVGIKMPAMPLISVDIENLCASWWSGCFPEPPPSLDINRNGQISFIGKHLETRDVEARLADYYSSKRSFSMSFSWRSESRENEIHLLLNKVISTYLSVCSVKSEEYYSKPLCELEPSELEDLRRSFPLRLVLTIRPLLLPPPPNPLEESSIKLSACFRGAINDSPSVFFRHDSLNASCELILLTSSRYGQVDVLKQTRNAVGGDYGYSNLVQIDNHFIMTAHGDYNGRTIVISHTGRIFDMIGGDYYVDEESNLLLSIYESDISGLSVFDLEADSVLLELTDFEPYPISIHKAFSSRYFIKAGYDEELGDHPIWEIDLNHGRIVSTDLTSNEINDSNVLAHRALEHIDCECGN